MAREPQQMRADASGFVSVDLDEQLVKGAPVAVADNLDSYVASIVQTEYLNAGWLVANDASEQEGMRKLSVSYPAQ